jgi:hypothetical protein
MGGVVSYYIELFFTSVRCLIYDFFFTLIPFVDAAVTCELWDRVVNIRFDRF